MTSRFWMFLPLLTGCVHLASVSVTPVPADAGMQVQSEVESPLAILGLAGNHDYVDSVVQDLRRQCEEGRVQGILTKHEVIRWGFLAQKQRVTAKGRCIR